MHAGAERIENPGHAHSDLVLPVEVKTKGLRHALTLIVTSAYTW